MLERINIISIITDHFKTLKSLNQKSNWVNGKDLLLFIGLPLTISVLLTYKDYSFKEQLGNLITAISIFGGFLFNLLAIIYSQLDNIEKDAENGKNELKKKFVKEIHSNISFCIVLSILIVISLLLTTIDIPEFHYDWLIHKIIIGLNYFLMSIFLLTLIMILNRVYILLNKNEGK
jgi:hypothetical protein